MEFHPDLYYYASSCFPALYHNFDPNSRRNSAGCDADLYEGLANQGHLLFEVGDYGKFTNEEMHSPQREARRNEQEPPNLQNYQTMMYGYQQTVQRKRDGSFSFAIPDFEQPSTLPAQEDFIHLGENIPQLENGLDLHPHFNNFVQLEKKIENETPDQILLKKPIEKGQKRTKKNNPPKQSSKKKDTKNSAEVPNKSSRILSRSTSEGSPKQLIKLEIEEELIRKPSEATASSLGSPQTFSQKSLSGKIGTDFYSSLQKTEYDILAFQPPREILGMFEKSAATVSAQRKIGTLTLEERRIKIEKYKQKMKKRVWVKKISYDCRKRVADSRLRIKGRFVTRAHAIEMLELTEEAFALLPTETVKSLLTEKFETCPEKRRGGTSRSSKSQST